MAGIPIGAVVAITGVSAAGKSTIGQALADRSERGVHVHGDVFRRWIATGRVEPTPDLPAEAVRQLQLRHELAAMSADHYAAAGFAVVMQDVFLGHLWPFALQQVRARPLHAVVLDPSSTSVAERERLRPKFAYRDEGFDVDGLVAVLHDRTPRLGLWLDTSTMTVDETAQEILARLDEARVEPADW